MKTTQHHPLISATARRVENGNDARDDEAAAVEPVIRLKLDKPAHWDWQLTTTADALPVIQLLDKDGKLLVETSGRVAQRARGSFRDGLKSHESFPLPLKEEEAEEPAEPKATIGNRNYEGFSSKFGSASCGFQPRKSRSEATVDSSLTQGHAAARKVRKRHSSNASELLPQLRKKDGPKRYSAGDYLRQQILEDLVSKRNDVVDEQQEPSQVARNRYKKMKAYLRSQSDGVERTNASEETTAGRTIDGTTTLAGKRLNKEDLDKIRSFLQRKIQAKMQEEQLLSFTPDSHIRENSVLSRAVDARKRLSDCARDEEKPGALKNYRTRKIRSEANIRFEPEVPEPARSKQLMVSKKNSSGSDKRKVYRKTKSDVLLSHHLAAGNSSLDSEKEQPMTAQSNYPTRRIKSQDNFERSWREYKERKKHERLHKDSEQQNLVEEDFMKKPRWKDLQEASSCLLKNCKVCENSRSCVDPMKELLAPDDRPSTSLQENYLMIDPSSEYHPKDEQSRDRSPDFGYNSISKRSGLLSKGDSCANSNVKKSDTFRVVDGRDEEEDEANAVCYDYRNKTNEDIARDYFRRVYELLRRRQEETKRLAETGRIDARCEDTSSSNYLQEDEEAAHCKRRRRRRKMEKPFAEGEDVLLVSPGAAAGRREAWRSINGSAVNCRGQQQQQQQRQEGSSLAKRPRHPAPPPPPIRHSSSSSSANKENNRPAEEESHHEAAIEKSEEEMGSNLSRHNGKGLNGRRAQSSGNLCDSKGISVGKILVPCSRSSRESRYKFCGSLPNHLDGKDSLDDDTSENNNVITDTISGNLGGTLPYKKKHPGAHYVDESTNTLDLVKHRSDESLDGDPWKYRQEGVDLVKCRHIESLRRSRGSDAGSTGSGCHHHHHHHEWRRNSSTLSRGRAHRSAELDVVGTLPKRRPDSTKRSAPSLGELGDGPTRASRISIDKIDDELLLKMVHKPDCELVKHRQQHHHQHHQPQPQQQQQQQSKQKDSHAQHHSHQQGKCVDLKLHKLTTGGEPQDQGYASERSPEDEHPPSLPGQPFPSVTPENTFRVTLKKSTRGLGLSVSGGGTAGPVRVKRLFPQQPAALSNKLQPGDILLAANDIPLTGLTNYEALEVLRTTSATVELVVSRLPGSDSVGSPPGTAPPPPPTRRDNPGLTLKIPLNPLPPLDVEPCGEFDIEMTKVAGSLGFTLRKADSSALGHYVRALVREPALSDGRIQPGDKIVAVDGAALSPMSHEEAVALLRQCGPTVKLRLYRDLAQTPVSALSPTEPEYPPRPAKTSLRQEAVDMLCDLAVRKLSPGTSSGGSSCPRQSSGTSCNSPRRLRRPATRSSTADTNEAGSSGRNNRHSHASSQSQETSDSEQCSIKTQLTNSQPETPANDIIDPPALYVVCDSSDSSGIRLQQPQQQQRPSYLDLQAPPSEKARFQYSFDSDGSEYAGPVIVTDSDNSNFRDDRPAALGLSSDEHDSALPNEPVSMPPQLSSTSSTSTAFSYKNPAYQSANPSCGLNLPADDGKAKISHSSEQDIPGKIMGADDPAGSKGLLKWKGVMFAPSDSDETDGRCKIQEDRDASESAALSSLHEQGHEVFMVELTRGWNSRLGFSLQPEGENTVISVVHPDSVAAKDGRLKQGDILIMVNDESVEHMSTANIIDLLRKIRGSIGITVLRRKKDDAT